MSSVLACLPLGWATPCAAAAEHLLPAVVDATKEAPHSEIGQSTVVNSPLGAYREVGRNRNDRMTYLFQTESAGDLIRLTLVYPDDRPRIAEVFLISNARIHWSLNAFGTGYFTGFPYAISGTMIEQSFYFHVPMSNRFAIVLMTSKKDAPAAVASLRVERVGEGEGIPKWPAETVRPGRRKLGLYSEDPVLVSNFAGHLGIAADPRRSVRAIKQFRAILDRQVAYMKRIGHNMVIYPVVWYMKALYRPSAEYTTERVRGGNRPHPAEFDLMMARRYSREGIDFWPSIRNWSLPSLKEWVKTPEEIHSGEATEYVNTVTAGGEVRTRSRWHDPPLLNSIHPRVRSALKNVVREVMDRIGAEPSVRGVALFTTIHSSHGLGTIDQSYDDYTLKLFSSETGIALPAPSGRAEGRFRLWHDWLRAEHWSDWIRWRKTKQTELYNDLADIVAAGGPGAKLQVMVKYPIPTMSIGKTVNDVAAYLDEIGLDLEALARNEDILISRIYRPAEYQIRLRWGDERSPAMRSLLRRSRLDFDARWQRPFLGRTRGTVIQYNYFEHSFKKEPRLKLPAEWRGYEPSWHVTSPKGAGRNALEYVARSIALYDAIFVTHGGFQVGPQGMEEPLQPFSAAFTSLPAVPFDTLAEEDGVVLRSAVSEGSRWTYLVNGTDVPREVSLSFHASGTLERLGLAAERLEVSPPKAVVLRVAPYDLVAWKGDLQLAPKDLKTRRRPSSIVR